MRAAAPGRNKYRELSPIKTRILLCEHKSSALTHVIGGTQRAKNDSLLVWTPAGGDPSKQPRCYTSVCVISIINTDRGCSAQAHSGRSHGGAPRSVQAGAGLGRWRWQISPPHPPLRLPADKPCCLRVIIIIRITLRAAGWQSVAPCVSALVVASNLARRWVRSPTGPPEP